MPLPGLQNLQERPGGEQGMEGHSNNQHLHGRGKSCI